MADAKQDLVNLGHSINGLARSKDRRPPRLITIEDTVQSLNSDGMTSKGLSAALEPPSGDKDINKWATMWVKNLGFVAKVGQWIWDRYYPIAMSAASAGKDLETILAAKNPWHNLYSDFDEDEKLNEYFKGLGDALPTSIGFLYRCQPRH